jgi:hypothetical protein
MINDNTSGLVILTDRSEGGASINDGQVELMVGYFYNSVRIISIIF